MGARWDILAGEYPPQPGGVADYTRLVSVGLADRGCEVHVWTTPAEGETPREPGVQVHRVAGSWSRADLARVGAGLWGPGIPDGRNLLVQYTPNAWGHRGMNLGFCRWLARNGPIGGGFRVTFHELHYFPEPGDRLARRLLPVVQRRMLRTLLGAGPKVDYTTEEWGRRLASFAGPAKLLTTWLPVPSNIPVVDDPDGVRDLRLKIAPGGETVVGAFGTYGEDHRDRLRRVFPRVVLARPGRVGLLIGHGADDFARDLQATESGLVGRLAAVPGLDPCGVSRHLQACDVMVQPYPDGVCARRGTAMACLAHGLAVATNVGPFTEPALSETGVGLFASGDDPAALASAAESLLSDPAARSRLGASGHASYERHFALERTIHILTKT